MGDAFGSQWHLCVERFQQRDFQAPYYWPRSCSRESWNQREQGCIMHDPIIWFSHHLFELHVFSLCLLWCFLCFCKCCSSLENHNNNMLVMFILSHLMLIQNVWKTNLLELWHAPRYSNMTTMWSALWKEEKIKLAGQIFCTLIYFDGFEVEYWTRVISIRVSNSMHRR
jgi:hypothetical protein